MSSVEKNNSTSLETTSLEEELNGIPDDQFGYEGYESGVSGSIYENSSSDGEYNDLSNESVHMKPSMKIPSSYKTKVQQDKLKSILINSEKSEVLTLNEKYKRTRRYDSAGKYRIGPSFITKSRLTYMDENKPAKLSVVPEQMRSLEFGLLIYLWTFTDQHDKQEIDLHFLQSLIDSGCNINCRDEHGQTILHAIIRDWHPDVALFVVRNNADVNAQDKFGRSPLHLAAALNSREMATLLLQNGAKVDLLTYNENQTPTHYAAKYNSLETMTVLIKFKGSFAQRDAKGRTALFLAAENGSTDTALFLLDMGAPAGVYDNEGTSCTSHLLEKMTHVAFRALNQFIVNNMSLKRSELYLSYLETNPKSKSNTIAKSPLEIITIYDDYDLIMHPIIQKAIEVKWNQFGRKVTLYQLSVLLVYLTCWMILAYTFNDSGQYYRPWGTNAWKIVVEALVIIFAAFFFYTDLTGKRDMIKHHRAWIEWKQHDVRSKYIFCHPAWPSDRQNMEAESERIQGTPSIAGKQKFWFIYELIMLLLLAAIVVTRILDMVITTKTTFLVHKFSFAVGMMASFMRVMKICLRFKYFSVFLKITGLAVTAFIQIAFFYLQFFIPFVAAFWLMFGGEAGEEKMKEKISPNMTAVYAELTHLEDIFFHVYESSFGQEYIFFYSQVEKYTGQTLISLFHLFTTFISLSILVASITSIFTASYQRCVAEASLLQASIVLQLEKKLNKKEKTKLASFYRSQCTPLIVRADNPTEYEHRRNIHSKLRLAERRLLDVENIIHDVEERYAKNDSRAQTAILETILTNVSVYNGKHDGCTETSKETLKELIQKQEHMNRCLPKLVKE